MTLVECIAAGANGEAVLRLPCWAHIGSTSQGRCYGTVPADISGIISLSLHMGNQGETDAFRTEIAYVLENSARVHDRPPAGGQ